MKIKGIHAAPALLIIIAALTAAANFLDVSALSENTNPYLTVMVLELISIGLPSVFFCLLRSGGLRGAMHLKLMRPKHITISVYSLLFLVSGSLALSILMYFLFPDAFAASAVSSFASSAGIIEASDSFYAVIAFAILPAVLEEFLFRGIISAEYSSYGGSVAVLLSSATFAMLHFSPVRLPIYFFMGIVLSLTVSATGSVIPAILIHTANNIFVLYFEKYIYRIAGKHSGGLTLLAFIIVLATLIFAILFFSRAEKLYYGYGLSNKPSPMIRKKQPGELPLAVQAILSPTLLIFVVFFIVLSVIM